MSAITSFKRALKQSKDDLELKYKQLGSDAKSNMSVVRTDVINYLAHVIKKKNSTPRYLEIGVRNPEHNFNKVEIIEKYSVDPGLEYEKNPVYFQLTSDDFFKQMTSHDFELFGKKFDLIFIDGLHKATQVQKDIKNSLNHLSNDGFIILHDCNPPTEWHARSDFAYKWTPAEASWNGTTWKAFVQARHFDDLQSCCIDSDWGIGLISKAYKLGRPSAKLDEFFEFDYFEENREQLLGLITFEDFKRFIK